MIAEMMMLCEAIGAALESPPERASIQLDPSPACGSS